MPKPHDEYARRSAGRPPADALRSAVAMLRTLLKTAELAMFEVSAGQIHCCYIDPTTESRAERVWAEHRSELLGGAIVRTEGAVYFPIVQERLVGVLEAIGVDDRQLDALAWPVLVCTLSLLPHALDVFGASAAANVPGDATPAPPRPAVPEHTGLDRMVHLALQEAERQRLRRVLDRHEWNVSAVARAWRVDRVTVYRKMIKLGLGRIKPSAKAPRRRHGDVDSKSHIARRR